MRVGYLGPRGTFTEEAARRYLAERDVEWQLYPTILDVLDAVQEQEIDCGVVPLENSIEGAVNMTLDRLAQDADLFVEAEIVLPIEQNLLVNEGANLADLREVWSHPQALAQCRQFIRKLGLTVQTWDSTARAASEVAASKRIDVAAIGPRCAAVQLGLQVLQSQIQDTTENHTRFVVVSHAACTRNETASTLQLTDAEPSASASDLSDSNANGQAYRQANKTMLLLTLNEDHAGALVHVLNVFSAVELNLTRIESRPTGKQLGRYQFFIDVAAGMQETAVQKAMAVLDTLGHQTRILGSYRTAEAAETSASPTVE